MMKNTIFIFLATITLTISVSSCGIKGHNRKEIWGIDESNERVFGDVNKGPRQLEKEYKPDETGKTAEKINKIKDKLYPKENK